MDIQRIAQIAETYQKNTSAPLGFLFRDLNTGAEVSFREAEPFPAASTFKLYLLAELYRQVHEGELRLDDRIALRQEDKSIGGGVLEWMDPGAALTLKDYAVLMMMISDNTATDILFHLAGRDSIRENVIEALALKETKVDLSCGELIDAYYGMGGRSIGQMLADHNGVPPSYRNSSWYRCAEEENDQTSPRDAAKLLELLYRGQWVSPETSARMLDIMKQCQTNGRIPALLPSFQTVAHKTGTLDRLCADVGIVYAGEAGAYILCLYYNGNLASAEDYDRDADNRVGEPYLAALSREIFDAYLA